MIRTRPIDSQVITDGDRVHLRYLTDRGTYEFITFTTDEYDAVKKLLADGMIREDYVMRPSAIGRFIKASTSASNDTAIDIEKSMLRRSMSKGVMDIMPYAIFCFLVLVGVGALYMMISKDTAGATSQIANAATSGLAIK